MFTDTDDRAPQLVVEHLRVAFNTRRVEFMAVNDVSFSVGRERLAIVGESGSGKSMTGRAIMRLQPRAAIVSADRILFQGRDLLALSERGMRAVRGRGISMILQDPRYALHPVKTIGAQIVEAIRLSERMSRKSAAAHALELLDAVRIDDPRRAFDLRSSEVSGGMGQRAMIAMMLAQRPTLVIADEPTSALDVIVRLQVLAILEDMVKQQGIGLIFISHDLHLVTSFCDRVLVMQAGRIVEALPASDFEQARHPYTRSLIAALPSAGTRGRRLQQARGDAGAT